MKLLFNSLLLIGCLFGFVACQDDEKDGNYPALYTDMLCVTTAEDGTLTTALLDNGEQYDVSAQGLTSDASNATLRCRASYTLNKGRLKLHRVAHVFSDVPHPVETFYVLVGGANPDLLPRDPVKLISMWKSGGYINLHLGVLTTGNGTHSYAFCRDAEGAYSLLHLRPQADAESYTEHLYLSMPIPDGEEHPSFSVYTYDGIYTKTF
jgi:hypothetical protein